MTISTKYHGTIDVKEEDVLFFEQGLPGFLDEKKFTLLPLPENSWFHILQSIQNPDLGFVVTDPFLFFQEYDFPLDQGTVDLLGKPSEEDIKVLSILTIKDPLQTSTANLQAPIIINLENNKAKQVILNNESYGTKHNVFAQPKPTGNKG